MADMCSTLSHNNIFPEIHTRVESLLNPPYPVLDDPWYDSFPSLSSFFSKGKNATSSKSVNNFRLFLHIGKFKPGEINVKTLDGSIMVEAKHEENEICREFKRSYELPDDIDPSTLVSTFNDNGLLVVKAHKKTLEAKE